MTYLYWVFRQLKKDKLQKSKREKKKGGKGKGKPKGASSGVQPKAGPKGPKGGGKAGGKKGAKAQSGKGKGGTCWTCGSSRHYSYDCPQASQSYGGYSGKAFTLADYWPEGEGQS